MWLDHLGQAKLIPDISLCVYLFMVIVLACIVLRVWPMYQFADIISWYWPFADTVYHVSAQYMFADIKTVF